MIFEGTTNKLIWSLLRLEDFQVKTLFSLLMEGIMSGLKMKEQFTLINTKKTI